MRSKYFCFFPPTVSRPQSMCARAWNMKQFLWYRPRCCVCVQLYGMPVIGEWRKIMKFVLQLVGERETHTFFMWSRYQALQCYHFELWGFHTQTHTCAWWHEGDNVQHKTLPHMTSGRRAKISLSFSGRTFLRSPLWKKRLREEIANVKESFLVDSNLSLAKRSRRHWKSFSLCREFSLIVTRECLSKIVEKKIWQESSLPQSLFSLTRFVNGKKGRKGFE